MTHLPHLAFKPHVVLRTRCTAFKMISVYRRIPSALSFLKFRHQRPLQLVLTGAGNNHARVGRPLCTQGLVPPAPIPCRARSDDRPDGGWEDVAGKVSLRMGDDLGNES